MPEAWDPLEVDFFKPPTADVEFKPHTPADAVKTAPGLEQLFSIQKSLIDAVNAIKYLEKQLPKTHDSAKLVAGVENAYRQINSYLRHFGNKGVQTF